MFKTIRRFIGKAYEGIKVIGRKIFKPLANIRSIDTESKSRYTPAVQSVLNKCGNDVVTNIRVCRDLVSSSTESLLNALSLGKWNELKKKYGYDRFFHLYILFEAGGKTLMLEKNQVINLSYYTKPCTESMPVSPGGTFTLNQMLDKTKSAMGDEKFFTYDPFVNNCQNFIISILRANGLLTNALESFIFQNIKQIVDELPDYMKPLAKGLTDVARMIDTSLQKSVYNTNGKEERLDNITNAS
jgi:hypothetical protein